MIVWHIVCTCADGREFSCVECTQRTWLQMFLAVQSCGARKRRDTSWNSLILWSSNYMVALGIATKGMGAPVTWVRLDHGNCQDPREWKEADGQVWRQMWLLLCLISNSVQISEGDTAQTRPPDQLCLPPLNPGGGSMKYHHCASAIVLFYAFTAFSCWKHSIVGLLCYAVVCVIICQWFVNTISFKFTHWVQLEIKWTD